MGWFKEENWSNAFEFKEPLKWYVCTLEICQLSIYQIGYPCFTKLKISLKFYICKNPKSQYYFQKQEYCRLFTKALKLLPFKNMPVIPSPTLNTVELDFNNIFGQCHFGSQSQVVLILTVLKGNLLLSVFDDLALKDKLDLILTALKVKFDCTSKVASIHHPMLRVSYKIKKKHVKTSEKFKCLLQSLENIGF